jgi:hypothetical protein
LIQEENLLIRKTVKHCQIDLARPGQVRPALCGEQDDRDNVIELSRFRENNYQPPAISSNDILLQGEVSNDTLESIRDPFIRRYRQIQETGGYLKGKTSFEISI